MKKPNVVRIRPRVTAIKIITIRSFMIGKSRRSNQVGYND
jgi:hypothetical protein